MIAISPILCLCWAMSPAQFPAGLEHLARVIDRTSHRASSHDRTGGNDDNVMSFSPGSTHVILDTDGPGQITHIWMTVAPFRNHSTFLRDLVIRMYWENSPVPSVEVPLGDFFAMGHGRQYRIESIPIAVGANERAMNCYWPMPFHQHARIEVYNNGRRSIRRIYFNIDYELGPIAPDQGLFHAEFRRDKALRSQDHAGNTTGSDNYVIMETTGRGHYVGCALFVDAQPGGWWGEGDDMIFIDGSETPVIIGTGSEDYFCNAWGYGDAFNHPCYGAPLLEKLPDNSKLATVYRWHVYDPVRFSTHIKVTIEHLFGEDIVNDYSSVAYWYQTRPITQRPPLPVAEDNHPRSHGEPAKPPSFDMDGTELETQLRQQGLNARGMTAGYSEGYQNGGWLKIDAATQPVDLVIPVSEPGRYRVSVKPVNKILQGTMTLTLRGNEARTFTHQRKREHDIPRIDLGTTTSEDGHLNITVSGPGAVGLDVLKIEKVEN